MERWSVNARVRTSEGDEHGLSVLFLCYRATPDEPSPHDPAHALIWSHTHAATSTYSYESWMDGAAFAATRSAVRDDTRWDPRVRRAVEEALDGGRPLLPDRLLEAPVRLSTRPLGLDFGGVATLRRHPDGSYHLTVTGQEESFDLVLQPGKKPVPLGDDGAMPLWWPDKAHKDSIDSVYTYCVPRLGARGSLALPGRAPARVVGEAWLEHSFGGGGRRDPRLDKGLDAAAVQVELQLDNGWDVAALRTSLVDIKATSAGSAEPGGRWATPAATAQQNDHIGAWAELSQRTICTTVSPDGVHRPVTGDLTVSQYWVSPLTMNSYPLGMRLRIPDLALDVRLTPPVREQESRPLVTGLAFWQGQSRIEGTMDGRPVSGHAFVEIVPPNTISDLEDQMRRVRQITHAEVRLLYPDAPDPAVVHSIAGLDGHQPLDDSAAAQVHASLVTPVRHVIDLGGKTWRSLAAMCVMALFGQEAERYRSLMAVTELLHTGALIVDDVEDNSPLRRGGPAAHQVFGVPTAINAGTNAYFILDRVADDILPDDPALRLRVYQTYLRGLRAAHAGQALDIAGHDEVMDAAVATGDATELLQRLHSNHRLKTAYPVRAITEISALLAGADEPQITAIGHYAEALGVAYQISDDVADLHGIGTMERHGHRRAAKRVAEDLQNGKVTMPLALAVPLLPAKHRRAVWNTVRGGKATPVTALAVARTLIECGAVDACRAHATTLLDESWTALDTALPPTMPKALLRALGWYAAQREDDIPDQPTIPRVPHPRTWRWATKIPFRPQRP
ncbi:polyprenyl synthetase family protein [Streptomyces sp. NPDC050485]|uniref:polyprenyl synthetase family protein n=1 Tax=Streptomyces sp. NPDC050485 TaxID=3365617 RepID=UPI0037959E67